MDFFLKSEENLECFHEKEDECSAELTISAEALPKPGMNFSECNTEKLRDSLERSEGESQFSAAYEGKLKVFAEALPKPNMHF